jgi:signal transduction histidine kinase/CheY-like chemotaxis protein
MKRITDKYHKLIKDDIKYLNSPFDIKEVPKRTYQLGLASLLTGVGLSVYDSFLGLYVSSFLIACFCFAILLFILLKYNDAIGNLRAFIIGMFCSLLITEVLLEGLQSEEYLYFFPLLVAVPIVVDLKQTTYRESITYISVIILAFCICILIGRTVHPLEAFHGDQKGKLAFINRIVAISSTIVFSVSYIFFEKKYINQLMEQSKRVIDTRTQFLSTMGHELRTPLNGIIGTVNLLGKDPLSAKNEEYLQILKYCSDHMLQLVNNILDYNKIEAGKLDIHTTEVNLAKLLANVGKPFASSFIEKGVDLQVEIDERLKIWVLADDLRLTQIFNNLLSNALKFTEKGYVKLKVVAHNIDKKSVTVNFSVQDTGLGIDADNQQKIFDGFWQVYDESTKNLTGTGLGLSITVRLLKMMRTDLKLQSEKGKGSTFSFDLVFDRVDRPEQPLGITAKENLAGIKILLVEDNPINMMIAKKSLKDFQAAVVTAVNGREAIDELQRNPGFDIVLMDLEMPVMNGYTAIYEVKKLIPHMPVVAFTASLVDERMLADLIESGFSDVLLKPFQQQQLLATIQKSLAEPVPLVVIRSN